MDSLRRLLWADGRYKLLVVLQAMDAGGKDGTTRRVFGGLNPQGVSVAGLRKPTQRELAHDYLWRVHRNTPESGEIAAFNRSHYEDVLIVRVAGLVPEERWKRRYDHIVEFERLPADEGTSIVKFFLHGSKDEQRRRLQTRLDDPDKIWKFSQGDLEQRKQWDAYMAAYTEMITRTSTEQCTVVRRSLRQQVVPRCGRRLSRDRGARELGS
jgi:PPK2 family polyphosphate:nucleotide phosphotransferase